MKTLVAYASLTGNTERIARAFYEVITGSKVLWKIDKLSDPDGFDMIFVGFPIYNFEPIKAAQEFIQKIRPGTAVSMFMTMSLTAAPESAEKEHLYAFTMENCKKAARHTRLLEIFDCPGELSEETAEALIRSNDPALQGFGRMRPYTIGFPNEENIEAAKAFAKKIMKLATSEFLPLNQC